MDEPRLRLIVLRGGRPDAASSRRSLGPGPFLDGGRKPTPTRVYKLLAAELAAGARMEIDFSHDHTRRTLPVAAVRSVSRAVNQDGFQLIDPAGEPIVHLVYPPYFIDWYLPREQSRDGWARVRFHEAIRNLGRRSRLLTIWIRWQR